MNQYRTDEEGGIDLSLAALAWDTDTQDDHIDYNHYAYRPRLASNGPPSRQTEPSRAFGDGGIVGREGRRFHEDERIEMTETIPQPQSSSSAAQLVPTPVPGSFSYAQMQHLELQRKKYGDNRELYEVMEWTPPVANAERQGQHSQQGQQSQAQSQSQYMMPPPGGVGVGGPWV